MNELRARERRHEVQQPVGVRRRQDELAVRPDEPAHRTQERAGRVQVLDDLAGDHDVGGLEPEGGDRVRGLRVDDVCLEAVLVRPADAVLGRVEADERLGDLVELSVQPDPGGELRRHELVHEADVDDALAARAVDEEGVAEHGPLPRQPVPPADALLALGPDRVRGHGAPFAIVNPSVECALFPRVSNAAT